MGIWFVIAFWLLGSVAVVSALALGVGVIVSWALTDTIDRGGWPPR
jgi:hypothetical protein